MQYLNRLLLISFLIFSLSVLHSHVAYAETPSPSWWSGDCNVNNHSGSYALGASYNGVKACGPGSQYQGGWDKIVRFYPNAVGEYEWQCVELSMRYMYLAYNVPPYMLTDGAARNIVNDYTGSRLIPKLNNGIELPTPGDILAEGIAGSGHTAIVTSININNSGTGTLTILEQNGSASSNGSRDIPITNNIVGDNVTAWLHDPLYAATVFQANTGNLFTYDDTGARDTHQGMLGGTSPSAAWLSDRSYEIAFVANTGELYVYNPATGVSSRTYQGVKAGTSPSITGFGGQGWQVVFQGADGILHGYNSTATATNFGQAMMSGTSPSIVALPVGGWRVAYQMSTGSLGLYSVDTGGSSWSNLNQGMSAQSSPSIASLGGSAWVSAFRANTGDMAVYNSSVGYGQVFSLGMANGTSPSVARTSGAGYVVLLQANTGQLWKYDSTSGASNTGQGLLAQTNPDAVRLGSSYTGVFQANTGYLYTYMNSSSTNTSKGMAAGTSPTLVRRMEAD